jgi:hypothetical protein
MSLVGVTKAKGMLVVALAVLMAIFNTVSVGGSAAEYLSANELELVKEMNLARTDPRRYANYLIDLRRYYNGDLIEVPGEIPIQTREGISGIDEAIGFLRTVGPAPALIPSPGMSRAARDHAVDQGPHGLTGHRGTDGSHPGRRLNRRGEWLYTSGENIAYGQREARRIVINQIVDDGIKNRGHRQNLFNPAFKRVGIACGEHLNYRYMCVMELAGGFREK